MMLPPRWRSWITSPAWDQLHQEQTRIASQMVQTIAQIKQNIAPEIIASIRAIANFDDAPLRLAMETIVNLRLENESAVFQRFIADALKEKKPLTKKTIKEIRKSHLSKKKVARLSKEERERITFYLNLLNFLIALIVLIQSGQPLKIDQGQFEKLTGPRVTINSIQILTPSEKPVEYLVLGRGCAMRDKPTNTAEVVIQLAPDEIVQRVRPGHRWLYVKYKDKEGWVNKKYLEKVD